MRPHRVVPPPPPRGLVPPVGARTIRRRDGIVAFSIVLVILVFAAMLAVGYATSDFDDARRTLDRGCGDFQVTDSGAVLVGVHPFDEDCATAVRSAARTLGFTERQIGLAFTGDGGEVSSVGYSLVSVGDRDGSWLVGFTLTDE